MCAVEVFAGCPLPRCKEEEDWPWIWIRDGMDSLVTFLKTISGGNWYVCGALGRGAGGAQGRQQGEPLVSAAGGWDMELSAWSRFSAGAAGSCGRSDWLSRFTLNR